MSKILTTAGRAAVDKYTIEEKFIPGTELVENAARAVEEEIIRRYPAPAKAAIVCGYGNNGADGLALARMLKRRDYEVLVYVVGNADKATELWKTERDLLQEHELLTLSGAIEADFVVDALFGVGLNRELTGEYLAAVETMNEAEHIISVDIPSGVCGDNACIMGNAVDAEVTIAFGYATPGHFMYPGTEYCGDVRIADIGLADPEEAGVEPIAFTEYPGTVPVHKKNTHKGNYGRLYMLTGSDGMAGAAILSGEAAYRAGCGLVYINTAPENRSVIQTRLPEAVLVKELYAESVRPAAAVAGCGLGTSETAKNNLTKLLVGYFGPIVLDADALNIIAIDDDLGTVVRNRGSVIMTPHAGELARLLNCTVADLNRDYIGAARQAAKKYNAIVVAKGPRTIVCEPEGPVYLNLTGCVGMATAGSGDVLTGIIGGLLARGLSPIEAAQLGVRLHGNAGTAAALELGMSHMMASDIIGHMSLITKKWN